MAHPYSPFPHPYKNRAHRIFPRHAPFYYIFLAIYRILCYVICGATSTPVGGSPFDFFLISFGGNLLLYLPPILNREGVADMFVTWDNLFQFCTVILAVILAVYQMTNKEK